MKRHGLACLQVTPPPSDILGKVNGLLGKIKCTSDCLLLTSDGNMFSVHRGTLAHHSNYFSKASRVLPPLIHRTIERVCANICN
jgi:BTB/POZ domain